MYQGYINKFLIYTFTITMLVGLQQCKFQSDRITDLDLQVLKKKYSIDAINYFYEVAFYEDYVGPNDFANKWDHDIWIRMEGELWPDDSLRVLNTVNQINKLDLPITLHITSDTSLSNLTVYFGDYVFLEKKLDIENYPLFRGVGRNSHHSYKIIEGKVGIANNASTYRELNSKERGTIRQSIILEEITQILGLTGDSWLYYTGLFYEGVNKTLVLSKLDKEIINLLYEPCLPNPYFREQFEADFEDILYHKNSARKLTKYIQENDIPINYLDSLKEACLNDSILLKFPRCIFVKLEGDFQSKDSIFCRGAVEKLNSVSDQLHLEIVSNAFWNDESCIKIQFIGDSSLQKTVISERYYSISEMMFSRLSIGVIRLKYSQSEEFENQRKKNKLLFQTMYKILGIYNANGDIIEIDSIHGIQFKPHYEELLSLLYNPIIPDGFSRKELDEVIEAVK